MNTRERNSGFVEGIVDVGVLVPACFENPLRESSVDFLSQVLTQRKKAAIPLSSIIGAYHITTRYLKVPRLSVKKTLEGMLRTGSPALVGIMTDKTISDAIDYATAYNIESWDGFLVALCRSMGSTIIYSLDNELRKVKEITVVNPFPEEQVKEYHKYLQEKIG